MRKSIIVAVSQNGIIGKDGKLPWHLSDDLKRFKALTMGHTLIMGRKTFESLPPKVRSSPGRRFIVLSRCEGNRDEENRLEQMGAIGVYSEWDGALYMANHFEDHRDQVIDEEPIGEDEVFICGGGEIYREALPLADRIYMTVIDRDFEGDTEFVFSIGHPSRAIGDHTHDRLGNRWKFVLNERGYGELPHRFEIWDRVR